MLNVLLSKLTLPAPCIWERYIKIKIKTFIKPFETTQRSVNKNLRHFFSLSGIRTGRIYKKLSILHQLYHQFFLNFDMVLETNIKLCVKERDFPEETFLLPKLRKWTKNSFWIYWKNLFYNENYIICCVPAHIPYLGKFLFLRYGPKWYQPIRLLDFLINHIFRSNPWNSLIFCMLIQIYIN